MALSPTTSRGSSPLTTKGDLFGFDTASARIPIGSDTQILTADSAQTLGLKWAAPAASGALTLLSTTTLSGDGTFDVSSISQAYNDLLLVLIARGTRAATNDEIDLRFNNDSGGNYDTEAFYGAASAATVFGAAAATAGYFSPAAPAASATAGRFGVATCLIYGYTSTTWQKSCVTTWHSDYDTTARQTGTAGFTWRSTAAINRVQAYGNVTANLLSGSVLRIYGRL